MFLAEKSMPLSSSVRKSALVSAFLCKTIGGILPNLCGASICAEISGAGELALSGEKRLLVDASGDGDRERRLLITFFGSGEALGEFVGVIDPLEFARERLRLVISLKGESDSSDEDGQSSMVTRFSLRGALPGTGDRVCLGEANGDKTSLRGVDVVLSSIYCLMTSFER